VNQVGVLARPQPPGVEPSLALVALCAIARFHQVAADPHHLAHQLGLNSGDVIDADVLVRAARHLGLKARHTRSRPDRLALTPMPALALMRPVSEAEPEFVILAQTDGERVLLQRPGAADPAEARPTMQPMTLFAERWSGELILFASKGSLAGDMARFDFSWFIPSLVKYRRLLSEVLLISFFLQLFGLVSPLFFQVVMDKVLVHRGLTTLDVLVTGLVVVVVVVFESLLGMLRNYVFSHTTSRIDVELGARLFRHLVQLLLAYFQARRVGDSVARVRELESIRAFLTGNALTVVLDLFSSGVFVAVTASRPSRRARWSPLLPGVGTPSWPPTSLPASKPRTWPAWPMRALTSLASSSMPPPCGTAPTW